MTTKLFSYLITLFILSIATPSFAANRFWVGAGLGNWNSTSNWSGTSGGSSGASVPGVSDIAIFDSSNVTNCAINANVNIKGLSITTLYTGTISINSGITTAIASSGFSQNGGTFIASNANISITGPFNLKGGSFTSTSAILLLSGSYTFSAGTFDHNNGTVEFSATKTITGNTDFYNLLFRASGATYTIASGTLISSSNNVTISGVGACTINIGTLAIRGDLTLSSSANSLANGGSATFLFDGTGTQNITSSISLITIGTNEKICALPNIEINKSSGTLNLSGIINLNGKTWKTTSGDSLINPGTSTININSSITFTGQNLSLYNIHIFANSQLITLSPATYKLTSTNNVIINGNSYYKVNTGILEILGDLTLIHTSTSSLNGGTGTFLFNGIGTQNINSSVTSLTFECALPNVEINKSSGALNFNGIINFSGASWNTVAGASLINAGTSVVNLETTATLSGQNLNLYDLTITGTFNRITISSGLVWTSTHLITFAGSSSWYQINTGTLNAKGDVLVTNTNTSTSVGGNATLLFDGTSNQTLTGSGIAGGGRLPKVTINKTGGTLTLSSNIISTDNAWTYINGTVDAIINASTVNFYKTSIINGQGSSATMAFYNVGFLGAISLGGNMDINGNLTIATGVNNRLSVTSSNYQINLAGNWTNNNSVTALSFNQLSGKVIFDGGSAQALTLASSAHSEIFYKLEMNNTSGGLTLNAPVTVSNNVSFIAGNIMSSASNILLLNNAATATGANNSSFVSGPVRKTGNQAFVFPTGKFSEFAPIAIAAPSVNTDQFTAECFMVDPNTTYNTSSKDSSIDHISRCEYWMLDRTTGTSNVKVTLSWDTRSCGVSNLSDLKIAHWDSTQWRDHGNGSTSGTTFSGTITTSAAVTSFSPFTLASITPVNPLPVELISFTGACINQEIVMKWMTASENNSASFTLEGSKDGVNWEILGSLLGAGNSSVITSYSFAVAASNKALIYCRLKQINYNGVFKYYDIIEINKCQDNLPLINLVIYPNPSAGIVHLTYAGNNNQFVSIHIYNILGEKIYDTEVFQSSIDISTMPDGIYFVDFTTNSKSTIQKIVLMRK